jgi:hypothetical protein
MRFGRNPAAQSSSTFSMVALPMRRTVILLAP